MTYIKTNNYGNACPSMNILKCDYCGKEFPGMDPRFEIEKKDLDICTTCMFKIFEEFILTKCIPGCGIWWLKEMEYKHLKGLKKKRSCYLPKKLRDEILQKYKFKCVYCNSKKNLTIDHIKPVSKGGTDSARNLQVLCKSCNSKKGNKL